MEFAYRNRKCIAQIVLIPLMLILLLALNFKIWGGSYNSGDFEEIIISQSTELNHCILSVGGSRVSVQNTTPIKQLPAVGSPGVAAECAVLPLFRFLRRRGSESSASPQSTLVFLSVRKDE
jgi:hypothetical protein